MKKSIYLFFASIMMVATTAKSQRLIGYMEQREYKSPNAQQLSSFSDAFVDMVDKELKRSYPSTIMNLQVHLDSSVHGYGLVLSYSCDVVKCDTLYAWHSFGHSQGVGVLLASNDSLNLNSNYPYFMGRAMGDAITVSEKLTREKESLYALKFAQKNVIVNRGFTASATYDGMKWAIAESFFFVR